jgi:hypothetical protein
MAGACASGAASHPAGGLLGGATVGAPAVDGAGPRD